MAVRSKTRPNPRPKSKSAPRTVDDYLARLKDDQRAALQRLRRIIKGTVPGIEEGISYQLPAFRHGGRWFAWIGAAAKHCALYGALAPDLDLLAGHDTSSRGTLRFPPDQPLPAALVKKLMKARIARNAARRPRS